jgi:PIN domain nuclease of toxin-antitoxin system
MTGSERLQDQHRDILENFDSLFVSVASIWEIAIKASIKKLAMPGDLLTQINASNICILPIKPEHALAAPQLPHHHRDLFDRMLVAQAQIEGWTIMTMDKHIRLYDVETI